ncbi:MAG: hypothetical protein JNM70_02210 [Anaerolineae bacterium]|nr:hypothetical protein [Anaerolineae bacterium]
MRTQNQCRLWIVGLLLFMLVVGVVSAQRDSVIWEPWAALDVSQIGDDNTGSTFAMSAVEGRSALMVTPSGRSDETKLAYPVSGNDLQAWLDYGQVQIDVYLPEDNALNPNTFFLGLGDVTQGWRWVGGLFGKASGSSGWITVLFTLDPTIQEIDTEGAYMLYLSFFQAGKTPLTEPFYVGDIHLVGGESAGGSAASDDRYREEVNRLLTLGDEALVAGVARETFDYFWLEANPQNGLIKDRSTPNSVASIAAVGFGLAAIPVGIDRGWITADEGYERAQTTLRTFLNGDVQGAQGFFFHFVDMETGERVWSSELSSIDTTLLVAGALVAGQYFEGTEVQTLADRLYENVEWDWMLDGGRFPRMGWKPESGFLNAAWDHFDESLLLYVLAIGSPTHPIPASSWDAWRRPINHIDDSIYLPGEPLFVYQYPLAFLKLRGLEDAYANYWNNTMRACERNRQFTIRQSDQYRTYQQGVWGLSASDGPFGYRAYGAAEGNHDGTVAPYASAACLPFTPEIALGGMRALLTEYGPRVWREYGFVSAINADEDWYSREHIGIDQGDILLMIANWQDGFVWNLFMANPNVQNALDRMGFVGSSGDYAVTPAYLAGAVGR